MATLRLASRRPIFRCLNAPAPPPRAKPQARNYDVPPLKTVRRRILKDEPSERIIDAEDVSLHRQAALRRTAYVKRRNWLAFGAALSMIAPMVLVRFWDLPQEDKTGDETPSRGFLDAISIKPTKTDSPPGAADAFQGKKVVLAAGDKIIAAPQDAEHPSVADADTIELVETGTSYVPYFPKTIKLPNSSSVGPEAIATSSEYTLLGLGIRKVSFLRVQVYVVGLYVKTSSLTALQNHLINTTNPSASALIPSEKASLRTSLLDPEQSTQIWSSILANPSIESAIRIVPTRGTDFNHLRDGLMRGIASRTDEVAARHADLRRQQAAEAKQIALPVPVKETEFSDETFGAAMKDFKALFQARGKAPKGSVILLSRGAKGDLEMLYQPLLKEDKHGEVQSLGRVEDERVSRLVWLLYLGGGNVSSEEARKSVVDGCMGLVERPVGTVEGRVQ